MIATSQSLASVAGLRTLQEGGNAIDAAITAAAVLAVIEPSMNGIGGDFFALVYDAKTRAVYGLDSSGRSSRHATPEEFARRGVKEVPDGGPLSVNVPGVIDGWSQMLSRFGTRSLAAVLQPAIGYAKRRFRRARDRGRRLGGRRTQTLARPCGPAGPSCPVAARLARVISSPTRTSRRACN
jgi:gamma-glutamyltranspeptidase/glutathione hydrolase